MAGINFGSAAPGMGRLAMAMSGGGAEDPYTKAYDGQLTLQSKLAQAMAAIEAHQAQVKESEAQARLHGLQADGVQQQQRAQQPGAILSSAMQANSIPLEEQGPVDDYLHTGKLGGKYGAGPNDMGPVAPAPDWQSKLGPLARSVGTINQALAVGDKSVENIAKAEGMRRTQGLSDGVLAGTVDPTRLAQAEYASKGSAPFSFHEFGTGNNLTGAVDDKNGPAVRFGQYRNAETGNQNASAGAHKAAAASSYASADNSRAHAAEARQRTEQGAKGVLQQTDQGLLLVDPRTGTATPVLGPNGQPAAKPKGPEKALPSSAAKGYLENLQNMEQAQKALDLAMGSKVGNATGDQSATGYKGFLPNTVLNRVDPAGVDTRAALANISSMVIHDRSGAAVSASEFPRLQPFVPSVRDDAATAQKKLRQFVDNYKAIVEDQAEFYRSSGYNVPTLAKRNVAVPPTAAPTAAPAKIGSDAEYNALPSGAEFIAPDGSHRRKP